MTQTATPALTDGPRVLLGAGLAWVAVLIYAAANSIVLLLAEIGSQNLINGRNVITFCNLIFAGSLMSLVPMGFMFWHAWTIDNLS